MAFIRSVKRTESFSATTSLSVALPDYEVGDTLVLLVGQDGASTTSFGSGPAGWTQVSYQSNGANGDAVYMLENAPAGLSLDFASTRNDTMSAMVIAVAEANGLDGAATAAGAIGAAHEIDFADLMTTEDNCLILWLIATDGAIQAYFNTSAELLSFDDGVGQSIAGYAGHARVAGPIGAKPFYSGGTEGAVLTTLALKSSVAEAQPRVEGGTNADTMEQFLGGVETNTYMPVPGDLSASPIFDVPTVTSVGGVGIIQPTRAITRLYDAGDQGTVPYVRCMALDTNRSNGNAQGVKYTFTLPVDFSSDRLFAYTHHSGGARFNALYGLVSELGQFIIFEDVTGNWRAYATGGRDAVRKLLTGSDGQILVTPKDPHVFEESGAFDLSQVVAVTIGHRTALGNADSYTTGWYLPTANVLLGGSMARPASLTTAVEYDKRINVKTLAKSGGTFTSYHHLDIGDGAEDVTFVHQGETLTFEGREPSIHVPDDFWTLKIKPTAASNITLSNMTLSCISGWNLDVHADLGALDFTNNTLTNVAAANLRGDWSGSRMTTTATGLVDDFDALIAGVVIDGSLRLNTLRDLDDVSAARLILTQTGAYNLIGCTFDEIENTSGGAVEVVSDSDIPTRIETSGAINLKNAVLGLASYDQWTVYPTFADRETGSNALAAGVSGQDWAFAYTPGTTYFLKVTLGTTQIGTEIMPTSPGVWPVELTNEGLHLQTQAAIQAVQEVVEANTTPQAQRDAMLLAPTGGATVEAGSLDAKLDSDTGLDEGSLHLALDSYGNKGAWMADTSAIAAAVQAGILNEGDGQQVIDAIVQAIGNENIAAATIAAEVWAHGTRDITNPADMSELETKVAEIAALHGLDLANPLIMTATTRSSGSLSQTISGNGVTSGTITRTS